MASDCINTHLQTINKCHKIKTHTVHCCWWRDRLHDEEIISTASTWMEKNENRFVFLCRPDLYITHIISLRCIGNKISIQFEYITKLAVSAVVDI